MGALKGIEADMVSREGMMEVWACDADGDECLHQVAFFWSGGDAGDYADYLETAGKRAQCVKSAATIVYDDAAVGELGDLGAPAV